MQEKIFNQSFLRKVASLEKVPLVFLEKQLKFKRAVILTNKKRKLLRPAAVGEGFKIKINANIGTSTERPDIKAEIEKLKVALEFSADTVMDLSIGGDLKKIRKQLLGNCPIPLGTVPIYEAAVAAQNRKGSFEAMTFDDIWDVLKLQADDGVDFFTLHIGLLRKFLKPRLVKKRVGGIVSRGGAILTRWMYVNNKENPFYENFDRILSLAKAYNITLSLGDGLRPGAIADSTDKLQISELCVLGELVKKCRRKNVQVMVEGPGHIRFDDIPLNMVMQKKICNHAPFYVLGPLPTDIAAGYDHISAAIGGAVAGLFGADFLCVVTPAEHLRHPSAQDIKEGVISAKIAGHSIDLLRFRDEWNRDYRLSLERAQRNWNKIFKLVIDKEKAKKYRTNFINPSMDMCTMCGKFCSLKIVEKCTLLR
jgi:phosphomethylpyrimidine synthase